MGTTSQKLTYLNDTKTKIRDRINAIGGSLDSDDTFRSYADELESLYNDMPKVTDTGDNITLENTRKGAMSIKYNGETQQDSTTGKNLCSNITKPSNANLKFFVSKKIAQTFTISFTTNEALSNNSLYLEVDGTSYGNLGGITASANTRATKTYTLSNENYQAIQSGTTIDLLLYKNGANFTIPTDAMVEDGNQVSSYEPYTGGSPAPSPSYPFDIHNVSGDNTIEICGKNLFDVNAITSNTYITASGETGTSSVSNLTDYIQIKANQQYCLSYTYTTLASSSNRAMVYYDENKNYVSGYDYSPSSMPKTFTPLQDGYVRFAYDVNAENIQVEQGSTATEYEAYTGNSQLISLGVENLFDISTITAGKTINEGTGNVTTGASNRDTSDFIKVKPNTQYTCSTTMTRYAYYDENKTFKNFYTSGTTITTNSDTQYIRFSYDNSLTNIQFEKGSKANSYTPYGTTPIELNKISTYQDYIYKDNDRWFLHKEIGKVVLDGSEGWNKHGSIASWFYYDGIIDGYVLDNTQIHIKTNYYTPKAYQGVPNLVNGECAYGSTDSGVTHRFVIKNTDYTQTNDFKNWLSTHNTIAYYVLATPTDTEITDTTLLEQLETIKRSYDGVTNISQENNDLPFILDVSALKEWE